MTYECKGYSYSASTELKMKFEQKIDKQSNELKELKKIIQGLEE